MAEKEPLTIDALIDDLKNIKKRFPSYWDFSNKYEKNLGKLFNDFGDKEPDKMEELLLTCVRIGDGVAKVLEPVAMKMLDRRKLFDWKGRPDLVNKVLEEVKTTCLDEPTSSRHYTRFMEKFLTLLSTLQIQDRHASQIFAIVEASFSTLDNTTGPIHNAALSCVTKFNWQDHPEMIQTAVKLLLKLVKHNPDINESDWQSMTAGLLICLTMRGATGGPIVKINGKTISGSDSEGTTLHELILDDISEIFNFCANQEWQYSEDPSKHNICYVLLQSILENFLRSGSTQAHLVRPMIKSIKELYESGDEILHRDAGYILHAMASEPDLTGEYTEQFLEQYINGKLTAMMTHLLKLYELVPEKFTPLLPKFLDTMRGNVDYSQSVMTVQLFAAIAKKQPELVTNEWVSVIARLLDHENLQYMAIMFLENLSSTRPQLVQPYEDALIAKMNQNVNSNNQAASILVKLANDEKRQKKYLDEYAKTCRSSNNTTLIMCILGYMRSIGVNCPHLLAEHKALFEGYRDQTALKDVCRAALDVIAGRSLEGVTNKVEDQQRDIKQLDTRVTTTDKKVDTLNKDVKANADEIKVVKSDVDAQGKKLDELKEVVDETVEKVEDLDHKTLSHAPAWSREVARMLNPTSDHDWRLLASRLGYSNDDIRNWATQPDPCLSMFDEWFATHKTKEATYGVLKTLVEMDRTDASVIVDEALDAVADIVDDDDDEPAEPPPVFLSYQWAHQPEVKLLKRHLGQAGYSCWMDVGQMGGGDKLFAKIDAGIRAAKVIVCCVTEKYAESPNCNREVNLSVTLGKPIIPLLMEKMSWPPPGAMGPIFGEYIFVRFFQRAGEENKDDRYWPADKFSELLMQLRYTIAPDTGLIQSDSPYQNWWAPPEEVIVIKPKQQSTSSQQSNASKAGKQDQVESPTVFISYQWDKQQQIKALYRKLTKLGYSCWLDIMQMGGGDSLYDKIDRGVRGCRVVVSCATSKYALSANCRREVSLADAIKKPIVPLKLETGLSWPPEGPMSMVFSQLLYIDFCKPNEDVQKEWTCPQFDQLIQQIEQYTGAMSNAPPAEQPSPAKTPAKTNNQPSAPVENERQPTQSSMKAAVNAPPPPPPPPAAQSSPATKVQSQNNTQPKTTSDNNSSATEDKTVETPAAVRRPATSQSVQDVKRAAAAETRARRGSLPTTPSTRACNIL